MISQKTCFRTSEFYQDPTIKEFRVFMNTLWKDDCFGTQKIIPKLSTIRNSQTSHYRFCNRYWYHNSKKPFMFFDRYWSRIHDLGDFIRRFFGISRCPSFPKLTKMDFQNVEICKRNIFKGHVHIFLYLLKHFYREKGWKGRYLIKNMEVTKMI